MLKYFKNKQMIDKSVVEARKKLVFSIYFTVQLNLSRDGQCLALGTFTHLVLIAMLWLPDRIKYVPPQVGPNVDTADFRGN